MSSSIAPEKRTNVRTSIQAVRAAIHAVAPASHALASRIAVEAFLRPRRYRTRRSETEILASARFERVPFGDAYLPTWTWGEENAPAVLLVHGWEGRGAQLASFVGPLRAAGFRVITFDAPGHGSSHAQHSSVVHIALAIERMAQAKGPFAGLVAHSVGGAATAVAFHFSRGALPIERCVLIAPPVSVDKFFDGFCRALDLDGSLRSAVVSQLEREIGVSLSSIDARACAPHLRAPMLLLHDDADREVPFENARTFVSSWTGAKLVVTSGLGHEHILRDPDVVHAAAAFIAGEEDVATGLPFGSLERDLFDRSRRWRRAAS